MSFRNRIAIIGRPNVGKSTLFNILTGKRKAVVKNQPGVTRDVQIEPADWCGFEFDVMDTGGLTDTADNFSQLIREQVTAILDSVTALICVMDGRAGLCPEDNDVYRVAIESGKPFIVVANKTDNQDLKLSALSEFAELGIDVIPVAFEQRAGITEILEWITTQIPKALPSEKREGVRLAIVGKPNVGKSSLTNRMLGEHRMIVSEVAGTTVDAIDTAFIRNEHQYVLTDTAGLRRKSRLKEDVEILAGFKSRRALERSDIVLLVVDGLEGPSDQDAKIIEMVVDNHKGIILVVNKLDLALEEIPAFRSSFREKIAQEIHFFPDIPIIFTSAKTGAGVDSLFEKINETWDKLRIRISTRELNDFFFETIRRAPAPVYGTKDVKFYYLTQTNQHPPSFIAFVNHPDGVSPSYRRFLAKHIKARWSLEGIPIRIFAMKSRKGGERDRGPQHHLE